MILILHGNNLVASRNAILTHQKKVNSPSRIEITISDTTPYSLKDIVSTFDIFTGAPYVVFDISKAGRANLEPFVKALLGIPPETTVIVLSNKKLTKSNKFIKSATELGAKIVESTQKEDSNVFKFVDFVFNGNRRGSYKELRVLMLEGKDPFYIFSMMLYGLRNVAAAKFNAPHFNKTSPYVKSKAQSQAKRLSEGQLKKLFSEFYLLDKGVKTGLVLPEVLIPLAIEKVLKYNRNA